MNYERTYSQYTDLDADCISFTLSNNLKGDPVVTATNTIDSSDVAIITPPCLTMWPRCTGQGNFGTRWGPDDETKTKFSLDLTDSGFKDCNPLWFSDLKERMNKLDDKLLDFVHTNQQRLLKRCNLSKESCAALQIRSIKTKYHKDTGAVIGHNLQLTRSKYGWQNGAQVERTTNVCDAYGKVVPGGEVQSGDVVVAKAYINQIYVIGDRFGIHWTFEDVCVLCQRSKMEVRTEVPEFFDLNNTYSFAAPYEPNTIEVHNTDVPIVKDIEMGAVY